MRINYADDDEAEEIRAKKGILLDTVDCRVCGAVFVPHLVTDEGEPFGLCDTHFRDYLRPTNRAERRALRRKGR